MNPEMSPVTRSGASNIGMCPTPSSTVSLWPSGSDSVKCRLNLLGGQWELEGNWPTNYPTDAFEVNVAVSELPLSEVAQVLHQPEISGVASGSCAK